MATVAITERTATLNLGFFKLFKFRIKLTLTQFRLFILFWTVCLALFELSLGIPWKWVIAMRVIAVFTNWFWDNKFYNNKNLWKTEKYQIQPIFGKVWRFFPFFSKIWLRGRKAEVPKMAFMKLFVNLTNFLLLLLITSTMRELEIDPGITLTLGGFVIKVSKVVLFAIFIALPFAALDESIFPPKERPADAEATRVHDKQKDVIIATAGVSEALLGLVAREEEEHQHPNTRERIGHKV